MDKYYFEGIAKAGKPRIKFVKANIGNRQFYLIASMSVPVQVGIYVDNFTVSISSQYQIGGQIPLSDEHIIINIPNRPYESKQTDAQGQPVTKYDPYLKFDSFDLRFEFMQELKRFFIEYWTTHINEYYAAQKDQQDNNQGNYPQQQQAPPQAAPPAAPPMAQPPQAAVPPQQPVQAPYQAAPPAAPPPMAQPPQAAVPPQQPVQAPPQVTPPAAPPPAQAPPVPPQAAPSQAPAQSSGDMLAKYGPDAGSQQDPNDDLPF